MPYQVFDTVALVAGISAVCLAVLAVVLYFGLDIRRVKADLSGKTAADAVARIRSRALLRKRFVLDGFEVEGKGVRL